MLSSGLFWAMALIVVVLLLTYLVTTADSAILIVNTINAAGAENPQGRFHIVFWGLALSFVVGGLLIVGGLGAIKTAMVIGALPFSLVMVLMGGALIKAVVRDGIREKNGVQSTHQ
jgi:choline-glycine betaine transporter